MGEFKYVGETREEIDKTIEKNAKDQIKYARQEAEQAQAAQDKHQATLQG